MYQTNWFTNKAVLSEQSDAEGNRIKSPIIGTAYLAPEPGGKPFVKVGDKVKKGQTIMIVEDEDYESYLLLPMAH